MIAWIITIFSHLCCCFSFSKLFYSIGKKRYESESTLTALPPLLHSMKLFMHEMSLVSPTLYPSLKLSGRLTFISTIYKSLNMTDETILATILALLFDSIEVAINHPSSKKRGNDLISWLARQTDNVVVFTSDDNAPSIRSEQRLGLQNSLLQLLLKRSRSTMVPNTFGNSKNSAMNPSSVVDILLESLDGSKTESCNVKFEKNCNVPFNLATMLSCVISNKAIPRNGELDKSSVMMDFVVLLTELIVRFGHHLQQSEPDTANGKAASINDFLGMCRFTESLIEKLSFDDDVCLPLVIAMMNLVASISLVSAHPTFKFEGWMTDSLAKRTHRGTIAFFDIATRLAERAYSTLNESNGCDQWSVAILTVIDLYLYQLSQLQSRELYHHINLQRLQEFFDNANTMEALIGKGLNWHLCLAITLSRLSLLLFLDGEGFRALQIANWFCTTAVGLSRDDIVWSETMLLTIIAESSIITVRPTNKESFSHPFNFEEKACKLRLYMRDCEYSLPYIERQLQRLLDAISDRSTTFGPDVDDVISWSSTTVYLGLSECAERQGCLEASVSFLKKCFEECRISISKSKRKKPTSDQHFGVWSSIRRAYISLSCLKRQVKCLYRTALLYHRLGNHRKSIEYAFSSLHCPLLEEAGLTSKSTFSQVMSLTRQFPARNSSETIVRRLYLRLKSLACSLDAVTDEFREDHQPCLSRVDDACKGTELLVNCELEAIVDMFESKLRKL